MTEVAKQAYYRDAGMSSQLAARYFRAFGDAKRILDLGCGTGEFGRHRPDEAMEIVGLDFDDHALARAQAFETTIRLDLGESRLPFDDGSFDAVLAKDILEHVTDPLALVCEVYRVLRPGRVLMASVVMARPRAVWDDYTHVRGFTQSSARLLFEDAGFRVEKIWRMGGVPLSRRLRFMPLVPHILRVPGIAYFWSVSWEVLAVKPQ
jgi:SAM-dependent methyltransferase